MSDRRKDTPREGSVATHPIRHAGGDTDTASQKFDWQLFTLKLSELLHQMRGKSEASHKQLSAEESVLDVLKPEIAILSEGLDGVDRIAREVWEIQGEVVTAEFVRDILVPQAMSLIETRAGVIRSLLEGRLGLDYKQDILELAWPLAEEVNRLKAEVANRYDIEARTLGYKKKHISASQHPRTDAKQAESSRAQNNEPSKSKVRAKTVEQMLHELEQIRPEMINESHYDKVQRAHPRFKIFGVASRHPDVKGWIENIQSRRDMVKLAQEITARHFRKTDSTIQTDWSHRKSPGRGAS